MPKELMINPTEARAKSFVDFAPIPVNQYDKTATDELAAGNLTKDDLVRIQRDMMIIRTFESMLDSVKKQGHYKEIQYNHRGPAHLSIGQEAAAVGQAFLLGIEDHIYRLATSHGNCPTGRCLTQPGYINQGSLNYKWYTLRCSDPVIENSIPYTSPLHCITCRRLTQDGNR